MAAPPAAGDGPAATFRACGRGAAWASAGVTQFWADLTLNEVSGAMGDLGVFLPLAVGLVKGVGLDLGTTLLFTGAYNVITGVMFGIPMPVQPMKTIAAVALAEAGALTLPQVMAAGIFVSGCVLALGVLGLMDLATRLIPGAVVRGMQLGLGLALALKGFQQVWYANTKAAPARGWWGVEGLCLGMAALLFILLTVYPAEEEGEGEGAKETAQETAQEPAPDDEEAPAPAPAGESGASKAAAPSPGGDLDLDLAVARREDSVHSSGSASSDAAAPLLLVRGLHALGDRAEAACGGGKGAAGGAGGAGAPARAAPPLRGLRIPAALALTVLGVVLTLAYYPSVAGSLRLGPSTPQVVVPSAHDWRVGILRAGLPQLSLTVFNSVVSVCQLGAQLFPDRPPSPSLVATSVGAMNMVGPWFGAMPCCHGAGGLAAQVRFGARTGAAPIFLGLVKIALSLLFGSSLFLLLQRFPSPLLGAMLVFAGVELAGVARPQAGQRGTAVMLFTAAVVLAMNNVAVGVAAGLIAAYSLAARDWAAAAATGPAARAGRAARRLCCRARAA